MNYTEKHQAFRLAVTECVGIENQIAELLETVDGLKKQLVVAEAERDARASEAAEEKITAGLAAIEMPDKTFRLVSKSRKGKKTEEHPNGAPAKHPYRVDDKVLAR